MKDIVNYGTSYKRFNIKKRDIRSVRDFMLPEMKHRVTIRESNMKSKGDFLMINPYSRVRKTWSFILLIVYLYTAIIMPYKIALVDDSNLAFFIVDTIVDFCFTIDVFVNMNSPIVLYNGNLNYHRKAVFMHYLKSWLIIDIIAA
jgi:hypothetical protein